MPPPHSQFGIIVYPLLFVVITCSMIFTYTVGLGARPALTLRVVGLGFRVVGVEVSDVLDVGFGRYRGEVLSTSRSKEVWALQSRGASLKGRVFRLVDLLGNQAAFGRPETLNPEPYTLYPINPKHS